MKRNWRNTSVLKLIEENKQPGLDNPIEIIRFLSRELVLNAFSKGWQGPPYDIIELAKLNGFDVTPSDMVIDARILPLPKKKFRIEYNPFQNAKRISFSIAHEIGHTLFSDCADTIRYRSKEMETSSWELEFLCNIAAAEILLPFGEFSKDANNIIPKMENLMELSNKYQASLESVFIRFCEVVNKPVSILLAGIDDKEKLEVQYSVNSDSSELAFPNKFVIPEGSVAYDCKKPGWTSYSIEHWEIFNDDSYLVQAVGLAAIRKHQQPRVGIVVVPEHLDEESPASLYVIKGDATEPRAVGKKIIAQVVNTSGSVGFGFGKSLSKKFPKTKSELEVWKEDKGRFVLGESHLVAVDYDTFVFQMLAQKGIFSKNGEIPLNYSSLNKCLAELRETALGQGASVHMPMIGAGQAKGDWSVIKDMIFQELVKYGVDVTVYTLPSKPSSVQPSKTFSLFDK